jgi:hypothetical protein
MFDDLRERAASVAEYEETEPPQSSSSALADMIGSFTSQQRFLMALMLFLNVAVIGCMCLVASGRIQF